jgi:hypothetical protein
MSKLWVNLALKCFPGLEMSQGHKEGEENKIMFSFINDVQCVTLMLLHILEYPITQHYPHSVILRR